MSPLAICFKLTQYAANNVFTGYSTEAYGYEFSEGATGNSNNIFLGQSNENASWTSQANLRYMQPENVKNFTKHYLTSKTTNDRNVVGTGATYFEQFFIDGTMPEANNNTGTFVAADADSKVIFRFNDTFKFQNFKSFGARLKVYVYGNSGSGMHVVDVTFKYLVADSATSPYAAKLCVNQVFNNPTERSDHRLVFHIRQDGQRHARHWHYLRQLLALSRWSTSAAYSSMRCLITRPTLTSSTITLASRPRRLLPRRLTMSPTPSVY
jgi:hypothetical protein